MHSAHHRLSYQASPKEAKHDWADYVAFSAISMDIPSSGFTTEVVYFFAHPWMHRKKHLG